MQQLSANLFRGTFQAKRDVLKHFYPFWSKSVYLIIPVERGWARVAMGKTSQALWQQQQCQNNQMWPMDRPTEGPTDQPKSKPVHSAFLPSSRICLLNPSDLSWFLMFFMTATVSSINKRLQPFLVTDTQRPLVSSELRVVFAILPLPNDPWLSCCVSGLVFIALVKCAPSRVMANKPKRATVACIWKWRTKDRAVCIDTMSIQCRYDIKTISIQYR